jgi:hypothetical protein
MILYLLCRPTGSESHTVTGIDTSRGDIGRDVFDEECRIQHFAA